MILVNLNIYNDMKREEIIKKLARKISNSLFEIGDISYEDMACAIAYLVGVVDRLSEKSNITQSGTYAKYVHDMIGYVYKVSSDKQEWRPSTEHPAIDEEVIALVGENKMISFAHIVDKNKAIDYDGWNIPEVKCWIPCPKIEED